MAAAHNEGASRRKAGSLDRRSFVGSLAAFGAGQVAFGATNCVEQTSAAPKAKNRFSAWDEVSLGGTGIRTSRLGFGTGVKSGNRSSGMVRRNGHDGAVKLVRAAYERGIRFFDTADSYGTHAVLMNRGRSVAQGLIRDVLTEENLRKVYDMDVYAWMHEMLSQWQ